MKVVLHDFAGHAFTQQLARQLARNGHSVTYVSFAGFQCPKGPMDLAEGTLGSLRFLSVNIDAPFNKRNLFVRWRQERSYARRAASIVAAEQPDVVISIGPIAVQRALLRAVKAVFIDWVQDIHAEAIKKILARRSAVASRIVGGYYRRREAALIRSSDSVIVITEAFRKLFNEWSLDTSAMSVIENWADLTAIPQLPRDNSWALENFRAGRSRIIYSGTLARKHDPDLLVALARNLDADVYLFSEGDGAERVRAAAAAQRIANLFVRPWVEHKDLPAMLAGADVLFVALEEDAANFSVPSKVLSYLCAGRAILASIVDTNLAAQILARESAGIVVSPGNTKALIEAAQTLLDDPLRRGEMGRRGRAYAESNFDIVRIASRFERIMMQATHRARVQTT